MAGPPCCETWFGDCRQLLPVVSPRLAGRLRLVYLDPPYNTGRRRGARRHFGDRRVDWGDLMSGVLQQAWQLLADDGFLAASINQTELFRLKQLADEVCGESHFVGLFPVKIRHVERQLMINATFHDVYEYLLIYRRQKAARFHMLRREPRREHFKHHIELTDGGGQRRSIGGKDVEIFQPSQYRIVQRVDEPQGLRRYVIAGKIATANWSGEWYERHLKQLGAELLIRVWGLEKEGLGYRWFQTGNARRRSGVYFQSLATAGRPMLPTNDLDYTEVVPTIFREGGPGCDFKDSKKPEHLLTRLLTMCTAPGDWVLDCFAGSGTTLAAAVKSGRHAIGLENDPVAWSVLQQRLQNLRDGRDIDGAPWEFEWRCQGEPGAEVEG